MRDHGVAQIRLAARALWGDAGCRRWHCAWEAYPAVIAAQEVNHLAEHERWLAEDLTADLAERTVSGRFITREELVRVTKWKMARGVWRQRNLILVQGNQERDVIAASREAFAAIPDEKRPIAALARLAGVGPATASAVLAAGEPAHYAFFDDLVAEVIPDLGTIKYTVAGYVGYLHRIRARSAELTATCPHGAWLPRDVERAVWAATGGKAGRVPVI